MFFKQPHFFMRKLKIHEYRSMETHFKSVLILVHAGLMLAFRTYCIFFETCCLNELLVPWLKKNVSLWGLQFPTVIWDENILKSRTGVIVYSLEFFFIAQLILTHFCTHYFRASQPL